MLFAHITTQVGIYAFGADKHWLDVLNMDRELNLPTLFSTMLLLTAARLLMQLSKASLQESAADWTLLSGILMFLAVDEALQIHRLDELPLDQVDMFSLVLIGNSTTRLHQGRMVTPRGYPGAELN